jgi:hypothetical protein
MPGRPTSVPVPFIIGELPESAFTGCGYHATNGDSSGHMHRSIRQPKIALFNHLVGADKQSGCYSQAERLGGLEADDEIEFGRLFDRDVRGSRAAQYLINYLRRTPKQVREVWAIR